MAIRASSNILARMLKSTLSTHQSNVRSLSASSSSLVLLDFVDTKRHVAQITLNDPSNLNALTTRMADAMVDVVQTLGKEEQLRAVVLTGSGRAFSAGGDLEWLMKRHKDSKENNYTTMLSFYSRFLTLRKLEVPVVGAVNGAAVGAGLGLALGGCDTRVAHPKAQLGPNFTRLGLHPGMAVTHFLPRLVGDATAAEWLLTGRFVGAEEALKLGLVSGIHEDPLAAAHEIAKNIASAAPLAVKECLKTLRARQERPATTLHESLEREARGQGATFNTAHFKEGLMAVKEKRPPLFD